ncbi:hypothetical protein [Novosphingobium sp.]|uniref:hypothetical protein n=1 Tax=Novosphingobium sp. TaxID=1874826 RepID=UPI003B51BAFD
MNIDTGAGGDGGDGGAGGKIVGSMARAGACGTATGADDVSATGEARRTMTPRDCDGSACVALIATGGKAPGDSADVCAIAGAICVSIPILNNTAVQTADNRKNVNRNCFPRNRLIAPPCKKTIF